MNVRSDRLKRSFASRPSRGSKTLMTDTYLSRSTHDATKQRLVEAAEIEFAAHGFEGASVRAITRRAETGIAAVNYHFGGKDRLYAEAVKFAHSGCTAGLSMPHWPNGTPPAQKLRDFVRALMGRMLEVPRASAMQLMTRELVHPTPAGAEAVEAYIRPMAQVLRDVLVELLPDLPPERIYLVGFSVVGQCLYYRQNRAVAAVLMGEENFRRLTADQLAEHVAAFTLAALGYGPPVPMFASPPVEPGP
jgi:AcrR family transcriptional regulator